MTEVTFKAWPKIPRGTPFNVVITEKMDGTNSCIIIQGGKIVGVQSRKRLIYPGKDTDNFGFAGWVERNTEDLLSLGEGYHFGEWAGPGIQKNPHNLTEKRFFLFNVERWNVNNLSRPSCCDVVPVLYEGAMDSETVPRLMMDQLANTPEGQTPEGIIVFYKSMRTLSKHTHKYPEGKWVSEK
jgi:hypothetical protein